MHLSEEEQFGQSLFKMYGILYLISYFLSIITVN